MNASEFERQYAKRVGVSAKWLRKMGRHVFPCHCRQDGCIGWQMVNPDSLSNHEVGLWKKYWRDKYYRLAKATMKEKEDEKTDMD